MNRIPPRTLTFLLLLATSASAAFSIGATPLQTTNPIDTVIIRIGTGDMDHKPGILIVGAVDARKQYASKLAVLVTAQLQEAGKADPAQFDAVTYYVYAQPSPDAALRVSASPLWESATNHTPVDDDRDGAVDEDGPEDLNGDGLITMMRVAEAVGNYIPHPLDPRVLIPVKAENGEAGQYSLYIEGVDNDHDEQWNEDPIGGVDFNRNFPFDYPYFQPGSGAFACCAEESKALADWLWDHPNIAAVINLGGDDNLHNLWPAGQTNGPILTSPTAGDQLYFERVAEKYKQLAPREGAPQLTDQRGSLLKWIYLQYGRWAFGVDPWWPLEPKKEVVVVKDGEKPADAKHAEVEKPAGEASADAKPAEGEKVADVQPPAEKPTEDQTAEEKPAEPPPAEPEKPKWDDKDKRGEYELGVLKWMDATGAAAFVPWTAVAHPDFAGKVVEVGGFKPYSIVPTEVELAEVAKQQTAFVQAVAQMLPSISFTDLKTEDLGGGITRLTVKVVNAGALPTVSEMGEATRVPYPLQLTLTPPDGAQLVTGRLRERLPRLAGGGGSLQRSWVISGGAGKVATLSVGCPSVSGYALSLRLGEGQ